MASPDQMELARPTFEPVESSEKRASTIRTILLHVQNDASLDCRVENALSLARACSAHLSCLHIIPIEAYVAFEGFGGVFIMNDVIEALDKEELELRSRLEQELAKEDVSWDYEQVTGNAAAQLVSRASLADLVVTARTPHRSDFVGPAIGLLGDLIFRARTPLFIPSESGVCDPTAPAVIAWDGSYEAANAVRATIGLLTLAREVRVVRVDEKEEKFPSTRLLEYLSRHGIHADYCVESAGIDTGDPYIVAGILAERARELCGCLVMGGYNHSRIGEYVFGGVTRTLLSASPVPIVIGR